MTNEERIKELFSKAKVAENLEECKEIINDFPGVILGEAGLDEPGCDIETMQDAIRYCRDIRRKQYIVNKAWWNDLLSIIKDATSEKKLGRKGEYWLEVLMEVDLGEEERRRLIDSMPIRTIAKPLFGIIEKWADKMPTIYVMAWYISYLEGATSDVRSEKIYNRLAFFYLRTRYSLDHPKKCRNYFRTLERHGWDIKNPYTGTFGEKDLSQLVDAILTGEFERNEDRYNLEYMSELVEMFRTYDVRRRIEGNVWLEFGGDENYEELKKYIRHMMPLRVIKMNKDDLARWHAFLEKLYDVIDYRFSAALAAGGAAAGKAADMDTAAMLLTLMYKDDNLLLKAIELKAGGKTPEYYALIESWTSKLAALGEPYHSAVLAGLYDVLINFLLDSAASCAGDGSLDPSPEANVRRAYELLEECVNTVDTPAYFYGLGGSFLHSSDSLDTCIIYTIYSEEGYSNLYGKPYLTDNAVALLNRYIETGETEKANRLKASIRETVAELESDCEDFDEALEEVLSSAQEQKPRAKVRTGELIEKIERRE